MTGLSILHVFVQDRKWLYETRCSYNGMVVKWVSTVHVKEEGWSNSLHSFNSLKKKPKILASLDKTNKNCDVTV